MEADDLDSLIADSLAGVQPVLESERKAVPAQQPVEALSSAGEAVLELQQGPSKSGGSSDGAPNEEFFSSLVQSLQDENFQKAMVEALQDNGSAPAAAAEGSAQNSLPVPTADAAKAVAPVAPVESKTASSGSTSSAEDFLQSFMKQFDSAVGSDDAFAKSMGSMMTSMLSKDLICGPLVQIADNLEPWLQNQKALPSGERGRYEAQLRLYRHIVGIYKDGSDPLPDAAREEVQRLLSELHGLGQPPDEVMKKIAPKEAEADGESFDDFMKQMGLADGLGAAEQDLLKKLTEDPEELTKVMQDMAGKLGGEDADEACKQQ